MFEIGPVNERLTHCIDEWRQIVIWAPKFAIKENLDIYLYLALDFDSLLCLNIAKIIMGSRIRRCKIYSCFERNFIYLFLIFGLEIRDMAQNGKITEMFSNFPKKTIEKWSNLGRVHHWQHYYTYVLVSTQIQPNFHVWKRSHEIIEKIPSLPTCAKTDWNG
jgi:hypothetical protein